MNLLAYVPSFLRVVRASTKPPGTGTRPSTHSNPAGLGSKRKLLNPGLAGLLPSTY